METNVTCENNVGICYYIVHIKKTRAVILITVKYFVYQDLHKYQEVTKTQLAMYFL